MSSSHWNRWQDLQIKMETALYTLSRNPIPRLLESSKLRIYPPTWDIVAGNVFGSELQSEGFIAPIDSH